MKAIIPLLTALLFCLIPSRASAEKFFEKVASGQEFNYTYISPEMAKALRANQRFYIEESQGANVKITYDHIKEVEIVSTTTNGTDTKLWQTIRELIRKFDLTDLSVTKYGYYRFDILGKVDSSNRLSHLLLMRQNGGNNVTVSFITGSIPVEALYNGM